MEGAACEISGARPTMRCWVHATNRLKVVAALAAGIYTVEDVY
jgi:hypothetical protein